MRLLCTLAALAIFAASVGDAIYAANQPKLDEVVTGSITRGTTPASYGLRYRSDVNGF